MASLLNSLLQSVDDFLGEDIPQESIIDIIDVEGKTGGEMNNKINGDEQIVLINKDINPSLIKVGSTPLGNNTINNAVNGAVKEITKEITQNVGNKGMVSPVRMNVKIDRGFEGEEGEEGEEGDKLAIEDLDGRGMGKSSGNEGSGGGGAGGGGGGRGEREIWGGGGDWG